MPYYGETNSSLKGNRFHRYLDYAANLISTYKGAGPFHLFLKKYFAANKKHGSKDRKIIASLCYGYFRLGFGVSHDCPTEEKLILGFFLVENKASPFLESLRPEWNEKIGNSIADKLEIVRNIFTVDNILLFKEEVSDEIDFHAFSLSFLQQPNFFIRVRPRQYEGVTNKLKVAGVPYNQINNECLAFDNTQRIAEVVKIDKEVVVQDYNSQRVGEWFPFQEPGSSATIHMWDCCAASGGKSILAFDILKNVKITVSDTRKGILENLKLRFARAGINCYRSFVADLSAKTPKPAFSDLFDLIIADVPCTGSGTWARTPEQIHFFSKKDIGKYAALQREIISNAVPYLKNDGYLIYITCSVFKSENELNVQLIQDELDLHLIESRYLVGYKMQASTLFIAKFRHK